MIRTTLSLSFGIWRMKPPFIQIGFIRYMCRKLLLPFTIHKPLQLLVISLHTVNTFRFGIRRHKSRVRTTHIYLLILISRKGIKLRPKKNKTRRQAKTNNKIITIHHRIGLFIQLWMVDRTFVTLSAQRIFPLLLNAISHIFAERPVDKH